MMYISLTIIGYILYIRSYKKVINQIKKMEGLKRGNVTLSDELWAKLDIVKIRTKHHSRSEVVSCIIDKLSEEELIKICNRKN